MSNKTDSGAGDTVHSGDTDDAELDYPDVKFCYSPFLYERGDKVYKDYLELHYRSLKQSIQNIQSHSPGNIKLEQLAYECSTIDNIMDKYYN